MQTTMASSICPLCKSPSGANANSNPLPSRLCEECRALLSTILPQAVAGSVVIVDAQKSSSQPVAQEPIVFAEPFEQPVAKDSVREFAPVAQTAEPFQEPAFQAEAQANRDIASFDSAATISTEPVYFHTEEKSAPTPPPVAEASETFFFQAEEKFADPYPQAEEPVEIAYVQAEESLEDHYAPAEKEVENPYLQVEAKSPYSFREPEFVEPPQSQATYVEQLEKEPEKPPQSETFFAPPLANPFIVQETLHTQEAVPFQTQESAPLYPQEAAPQHFYPQESAPLYGQESVYQNSQALAADAPPAWDEGVDNYPVLMVQEEKRSLLKPLIAIAAMALIAFVAAGYWFVYKPFFSATTPNATQRAGASVEDTSQPAQPTKPEKSAQTNPPAPAAETPANATATAQGAPDDKQTPVEEAKATSEEQTGQGKYSLQAASFPSEPAAKEFSEKLIRSGVPAYIATANIAGKGRWFRVRVGRFANPADAEKYAAQAKQRTKAAGLNLQLVICDYNNQ